MAYEVAAAIAAVDSLVRTSQSMSTFCAPFLLPPVPSATLSSFSRAAASAPSSPSTASVRPRRSVLTSVYAVFTNGEQVLVDGASDERESKGAEEVLQSFLSDTQANVVHPQWDGAARATVLSLTAEHHGGGISRWVLDVYAWFRVPKNLQTVAHVVECVGGVLTIAGLVLTPATAGGSLVISLVGGVLVVIGSLLEISADRIEARTKAKAVLTEKDGTKRVYVWPDERTVDQLTDIALHQQRAIDALRQRQLETDHSLLIMYRELQLVWVDALLLVNFRFVREEEVELLPHTTRTTDFTAELQRLERKAAQTTAAAPASMQLPATTAPDLGPTHRSCCSCM